MCRKSSELRRHGSCPRLLPGVTLIIAALLYGSVVAADGKPAPRGTIVHESIDAAALRGNLLGESSVRGVSVYLPNGYDANDQRRYPVIYLLHGYTANDRQWSAPPRRTPEIIDAAIASGAAEPTIIVWPDGSNSLLGSFYTDSVTAGDWEQFITTELVQWTDAKYRTLAHVESRGIAGHSMGGYGALKLAIKHPEIYGAVYAMSPCCLGWGQDVTLDNPAWRNTLQLKNMADVQARLPAFAVDPYSQPWLENMYSVAFMAMAVAWSPDPAAPPFFAALPVNADLTVRESVRARWSANMPLNMLDQYHGNLRRLRGIGFDVGVDDAFKHIPVTTRELSRRLRAMGIAHQFEEYPGKHSDRVEARIGSRLLPFFKQVLDGEGRTGQAAAQHSAGRDQCRSLSRRSVTTVTTIHACRRQLGGP